MSWLRKFEEKMISIDNNKIFVFVCILVVFILMIMCVGAAIIITQLATS
jgi:hypothetical protein